MNNFSVLLRDQGNFEVAEFYCVEALKKRRDVFGNRHLSTIQSMNNLGCIYQSLGNYDVADQYLSSAYKEYTKQLMANSPEALRCMNNIAANRRASGLTTAARLLYKVKYVYTLILSI